MTQTPPRLHMEGRQGAAQKSAQARLRFTMLFLLGLYALMAVRLYDVTMLTEFTEPDIEAARSNEESKNSDILHYGRADIVDRNGILLATSLPVASLYADPSLVTNATQTAQDIARILPDQDPADLKNKLSREGRFVWIKRGITPAQQQAINALGYPSLGFQKENRRFYPHGNLLAHAIGATNIDSKGQAGLEFYMNTPLSRRLSPLPVTLDVRLQYAAHKALAQAVEKFDAIGGVAMIADVKEGALLAAVSLPDFDPHHFGASTGNEAFTRFTHGVYEMGSTFKIFSTAAYLDDPSHSVADIMDASEPLRVGRFSIRDFHAQDRAMTVADVFLHSSNIGTALMAQAIGDEGLKRFYKQLGFFTSYNAQGLHTAAPLTPQVWREANTLTASYGHGIAVSPVHLMNAFISVISDGTIKGLHLLPDTQVKDRAHERITTRILEPRSVDMMRRLLRLSVTHGTGQFADLQGYQIGGKTGTSEKIGENGYTKDRLISSFIGAFPISDPRYAIYVMVDEPKGRKDTYGYATGGWVAAPAVRQIVADMAAILSIPPVNNTAAADEELLTPLMPHIKDKEPANTAKILRRGKADFIPRFTDFHETSGGDAP